jgi:hypothetical protein
MDFDKLYPGQFLKAGMFSGRDVTLTIASVKLDELEGRKGKEMKGIISFSEKPQRLVLNKTNGLCLKAMFGRETEAWVGKRVTLYPAKIQFEDNDLAIRVRGSPDLLAPVIFTLKLARKADKQVTLARTGPTNGKPATSPAPTPPSADEPPPPSDEPPMPEFP